MTHARDFQHHMKASIDPKIISLTDFKTLIEECQQSRTVGFEFGGKQFGLRIRSLTSVEMSAAKQITAIIPPKTMQDRFNGLTGRTEKVLDHDYSDEEFVKKAEKAERLRRAFILEKGLVDLKPTGETADEKLAYFENNFPLSILESLKSQIESIPDDELKVIEGANFFFASDSSAAQS